MAYLLDANVFIQAKNLHYGLDFCPAFWEWLEQHNDSGQVFSIEKVGDELLAGDDALAVWAEARGRDFFLPPAQAVLPALARVALWANGQGFEPGAVATFLQLADYWLVAHTLAHGFMIVTHEVPSASVRKIKIPTACVGLEIHCVTPYEMLRRERARFVLGRHGG
jgi:hypothetical protein